MQRARKQKPTTVSTIDSGRQIWKGTSPQRLEKRAEHAKRQMKAYAPELVERMKTWPFHHRRFDYEKKLLVASAWLLDTQAYFLLIDATHAKRRADIVYQLSRGFAGPLVPEIGFGHSMRILGLEYLNERAAAAESWLSTCKDDVRIASILSARPAQVIRYIDVDGFGKIHPCLLRIFMRLRSAPFCDVQHFEKDASSDDERGVCSVQARLPESGRIVTVFHSWEQHVARYVTFVYRPQGAVASLGRNRTEDVMELLEFVAHGGDIAARMTPEDESVHLDAERSVHVCSAAKQGVCRCEGSHDYRNMLLCSGCKVAFYCSVECQKAHRAHHKPFCSSNKKVIV